MKRFWFHPFWRITRWGFLPNLFGRSFDEYGRPTTFVVVPMVGMFVKVR